MKKLFLSLIVGVLLSQSAFAVATNPFTDLSSTNPNFDAIMYLYENGVIQGYPDGTFKPDNEINRVEFLKILIEGINITPDSATYNNCFPDVTNEWFAPYVCYAKEQGWVQGYPDNTFKPVNTVNKVESIKLVLVTQGFTVPSSVSTSPYTDVSVNDWFAPYVSVAKQNGLLVETGSTLNPGANMTRGGVSEMTYRAIKVKQTPAVSNVSIANFAFSPTPSTITAGTTVKWTNNDSVPHQVKSDTGLFESQVLSNGDTFEFKFDTAGTYNYHCNIHPSMTASIIVQ